MSFRDSVLAKYDANGNGRLDGKEKLAARSDISRYRSDKRKLVYAQQRYKQSVRTAQSAYVRAAMRQPKSYLLPPVYAASHRGKCEDTRYGTVNYPSPAMRRVNRPPPSSAPGLIRVPVTKIKCCSPGE